MSFFSFMRRTETHRNTIIRSNENKSQEKRVSVMKPPLISGLNNPSSPKNKGDESNDTIDHTFNAGRISIMSPSKSPKAKRGNDHKSFFKRQQSQIQTDKNSSDDEADSPKNGGGYLSINSSKKSSVRMSSLHSLVGRPSSINMLRPSLLGPPSVTSKAPINLASLLEYTDMSPDELMEAAIHILKKPPRLRSIWDIKSLMKSTENIMFFKDIAENEKSTDTIKQCCKFMYFKFFQSGDTVFQEGTRGDEFFIILKGEVSVFKKDKKQPTDQNKKPANENNNDMNYNTFRKALEGELLETMAKSLNLRLSTRDTGKIEDLSVSSPRRCISPKNSIFRKKKKHGSIINEIEESEDAEPKKIFVKNLPKGASFGELALLENRPRAATIICKTDCYFAVLQKSHFNTILRDMEQRKIFTQIEFLSSMKLFQNLSFNLVKQLYYFLDTIDFSKNQIVYKEKDESNYVYLIKTGEFMVSKHIIVEEIRKEDMEKEPEIFKKEKDKNFFGRNNVKKKVDICLLGQGEFFGEEEILSNSKRNYRITCNTTNGSLFCLRRDEFQKRLMGNPEVRVEIRLQSETKQQWLESHMQKVTKIFQNPKKTMKDLSARRATLEKSSEYFVENGEDRARIAQKNQENLTKISDFLTIMSTYSTILRKRKFLDESSLAVALKNGQKEKKRFMLSLNRKINSSVKSIKKEDLTSKSERGASLSNGRNGKVNDSHTEVDSPKLNYRQPKLPLLTFIPKESTSEPPNRSTEPYFSFQCIKLVENDKIEKDLRSSSGDRDLANSKTEENMPQVLTSFYGLPVSRSSVQRSLASPKLKSEDIKNNFQKDKIYKIVEYYKQSRSKTEAKLIKGTTRLTESVASIDKKYLERSDDSIKTQASSLLKGKSTLPLKYFADELASSKVREVPTFRKYSVSKEGNSYENSLNSKKLKGSSELLKTSKKLGRLIRERMGVASLLNKKNEEPVTLETEPTEQIDDTEELL